MTTVRSRWIVVSSFCFLVLLCIWLPTAAAAAPPPPTKPTVTGGVSLNGKNYVNGTFTLSSYSAGAHHYRVCRSNDTTGWGGCDVVMTTNSSSSFTVSGSNLPSEGYRRAFRFSACDAANDCTRWADNDEVYVQMDTTGPTAPGPSTTACACQAPDCWVTGTFTVSVTPASDSGSGANPNGYRHCRSEDSTGGFAGCQHDMTTTGTTSFTVSGSELPSDGYRRAYWVQAKDYLGNKGNWNTPLYLRVDRHHPTVSADNASNSWFTSRTVTITAADSTVSAAANSGLAEVRYRWNAAHNGSCTTGTLTSNGATLTVPEGDNHLYLCAKDCTGRIGFWNGGPYRVDSTSPAQNSLTISNDVWIIDDNSTYSITGTATDSGSGVREMRALINYQGSNNANRRGYFSWRDQSLGYQWSADQVACTGGGFASKHPKNFNPATVTLVGCSTSVSGGQRSVTFTVKPAASFGVFGRINDISLWARDFVLNPTGWKNHDLNFVSGVRGTLFGYAGIAEPSQLMEVDAANIPTNLAFIVYQWDTSASHYWRTLDTAGMLAGYQQLGAKAVLSIENVIFERIDMEPDSTCTRSRRFRLRTDPNVVDYWKQLLDEFDALHGAAIRSGGVELILVASEVNNECALIDEVEVAAERIKELFPGIPLAMAYGATYSQFGDRLAEAPPDRFPDVLDSIGIWSYNTFDPNNPLEQRNATSRGQSAEKFYNPSQPNDPTTIYGDLLSKLKPHQTVHLIFDAMWNSERGYLGWLPEDLGEVTENYATFMAYRPEVVSMIGYIWSVPAPSLGMSQLPPSVTVKQQEVACRYFGLRPRGWTADCRPGS